MRSLFLLALLVSSTHASVANLACPAANVPDITFAAEGRHWSLPYYGKLKSVNIWHEGFLAAQAYSITCERETGFAILRYLHESCHFRAGEDVKGSDSLLGGNMDCQLDADSNTDKCVIICDPCGIDCN